MGRKAKKVGKNRQDKFYHLAKEQGYRSRAAFKLVQLNKRFNFLGSAARGCIDLCAAPGGWMQIARKYLPLDAPCIGVDLVPIRPVPGCVGIVGDITSDATRSAIRRELKAQPGLASDEKVDVVLNDGSPNMGSAWLQDAYTQSELTLAGVRLATDHLAPGGSFVTKVFRSNDYNSLLFVMNQLFKRVTATKPSASRAESAEIYVFCTGYRAPKSIDSRLLNPKFVFKDWTKESVAKLKNDDTEQSKPDIFLNTVMKTMKKGKRNREGYEEGNMTLFKKITVLNFLRTSRPIALITETNQFSFDVKDIEDSDNTEIDEQSLQIAKSLEETDAEILSCCEDLKVLARREFKALIKWRSVARDALIAAKLLEGAEESKDNEEKTKTVDEDGIESDNDIEEEFKEARKELMLKEKRKIRKARKLRNAVQRKIDMKIFLPGEFGAVDNAAIEGMFSLKTASKLEKLGSKMVDVPDHANDADDEADTDALDSDEERIQKKVDRSGGYSLGDAEEKKKSNAKDMERELDMWYNIYAAKAKKDKHGVAMEETKERKRQTKRRALREAAAARAEEAENKEQDGEPEETRELEVNSDASSGSDVDMTGGDINLGKNHMTERDAALWFSQPLFNSAAVVSSSDEEMEDKKSEDEGDYGGGSEDDVHRAARKEALKKIQKEAEKRAADGEADGFETVPQENKTEQDENDKDENNDGAESDSSFHSSDYDTDEKAEMVAIGKQMRTSRQKATEILDDAYNRYTVDDPVELPRWFADRDPEYRFRREPVSKEQVAEMKAYIKSLQAAPTKKEAEAKARQKARIEKRLEAMKTKANSIAEQSDMSASSRMKAIEALYKTASRSTSKGKKSTSKQYQVVRPGGVRTNVGKSSGGRRGKGSGKTVLVDKRLKSDKRGIKKAQQRSRKARGRKGARG